MNKLVLKKLLTSLLFIFVAIATEIFLFVYLGLGIIPTYFLMDLGLILFIAFAIFFVRDGWVANLLLFFFLSCQILLSYINICISVMLSDIFTFKMLSLVAETALVLSVDMFPVWPAVFYVSILTLTIVATILLNKIKIKTSDRTRLRRLMLKNVALWGVVLSFCIHTVGVVTIDGKKEDELYILSDRALYNTFSSNKQALIKFGTYGFYFDEFFRQFVGDTEWFKFSNEELDAFAKTHEYNPQDSSLWGVAEGDNVFVIMAETFEWYLISEELTPTLFALANGYDFGSREDGYKNFNFYNFDQDNDGETDLDIDGFTEFVRSDYTYDKTKKTYYKNILDSSDPDNIIYQYLFDNDELFNNYGLTLSEFYSKAKTDYSEASVILGNYPYNESFTTHGGVLGFGSTGIYSELNYGFSLPNMLKNSGAVDSTKYMHSYHSTFYGRDSLIKRFGFEETLFLDQMSQKIPRGDSLAYATLDSKVMDYYLNIADKSIIPNDQTTFNFFTTVITHGGYEKHPILSSHYEFMESMFVEDHIYDTFGDYKNMSDIVFDYLTAALDAEYMMTLLVKHLIDTDQFDNTTIVLYSDHNSYFERLDLTFKKDYYEDLNKDNPDYVYNAHSPDRFNVPAFIYSTKINDAVVGTDGHNVTKLTNAFDMTTTIMTMLGVDYNPSFYYGYPVLCNQDGTELGQYAILSPTGGIFNKEIYTDDGRTLVYSKNKSITQEETIEFAMTIAKVLEKRYKITAFYQYDLFKYYLA